VDKYPVRDIEGIGPVYGEKLEAVGIEDTMQLLERCKTPADRNKLEEETGIGNALILEWANLADLMRISGISEEYSDLLEEAGVDTVKELATRNAQNLYEALKKVNEEMNLVRRLPSLGDVSGWITQAGELPRMLEY